MDGHREQALAAMSGGVDSSVVAALLVEGGYETAGVTMELFDGARAGEGDGGGCPSNDVHDAQAVCVRLGIPHHTVDLQQRFDQRVVRHFCTEYLHGRTPNPCVDCNRYLKFEALQDHRRAMGFDYVATGHYARRHFDEASGRWQLLRGKDVTKDQSYFLYHLTQDDLAHMLFPLGELTKAEVRAIATEHGFSNADKVESQDICFVIDGDHVGFIEDRVSCGGEGMGASEAFEPGEIVDRSGRVLGEHRGLIHYTTGQRKGIGIAAAEPLYVFGKDVERNRLIVGGTDDLLVDEVAAEDINLISVPFIEGEMPVQMKTHYRQQPVDAVVRQVSDDRIEVRYAEPQRIASPGQALVLYDGDVVVGGGTIV